MTAPAPALSLPVLRAELVELGREAWRITERERAVRSEISSLQEAEENDWLAEGGLRCSTHTAVAQEGDRYAAARMAATAAAKAKRLWPDVIGEVLADEIMALLDLPLWLRSQTRTLRLINAILSITERTDTF